MFPGSKIEKCSTFIEMGDTLFALFPASDASDPCCSSILENYVVLMSVSFTTWVERLNEPCSTPLNSRVLMESKGTRTYINRE